MLLKKYSGVSFFRGVGEVYVPVVGDIGVDI